MTFRHTHKKCRDCPNYFRKSRADRTVRCPECRGRKAAEAEAAKATVECRGSQGFAVVFEGRVVAESFVKDEAVAAAEAQGVPV